MYLRSSLLLAIALFVPREAQAAQSQDSCSGFIDSLPATISTAGTWCLRRNFVTRIHMGSAILIEANNVTIDCNGFRIGGLMAGTGTVAKGISALQRNNIVVRNCNVRGFAIGIDVGHYTGGGHFLVENNRVQASRMLGIRVDGEGSVVRGNTVVDTGGTTAQPHDEPNGIRTNGATDVIDNTVDGVAGEDGAYGIFIIGGGMGTGGGGSSVRDNRVRGVARIGATQAIGIYNQGGGPVSIRDNDVFGLGGTVGIGSNALPCRARGNTVIGFAVGIHNCADAGGNDVTP